jgi:DNA-binding GntR family transcriptional regulator
VSIRWCSTLTKVVEVSVTLYEKTMEFIRQLMADSNMVPGDRLPSEVEIAHMSGVSLMTVRRAMSELVSAGALQRIQGRGTFVRSNRIPTESTIIGGLKETLTLQGVDLETIILSFDETVATDERARLLRLSDGVAVWRIVRVRRLNGVPAVRETAIIPKILAPDLDVRFTSGEDSLYEILASSYGLSESVEEQTLIARRATETEILALELKKGAFVIEVAGVAVSSGTAFDSFEMVFVPHFFAFRLRTTPTADLVSNN